MFEFIKKNKTAYSIITTIVLIAIGILSSEFGRQLVRHDFAKYQQFKSLEGSFSVLLPNKVSETKETINTAAGPIVMHNFTAKAKYHEFAIAYSDYPEEILNLSTPEKSLSGARDGCLRNVQGTLLSETFITLDGYPGRDLRIEGPGKIIIEAKIILMKNRLYQILVVCQPDHSFDNIVEQVIKSFEIVQNNKDKKGLTSR